MADRDPASGRKPRLRLFQHHLIAYFAVMIILVAVNVLATPEFPWFIWPMIGWMAPIAIHAAYAMGLFDTLRR